MFIVIEVQKSSNDTVTTLTYSYADKNEAEAKFHLIMAAAAVSQLPVHSCIMIDEKCMVYRNEVYKHYVPVEPEGETEPTEE